MASVFDIVSRKVEEFRTVTRLDAEWRQREGMGLEVYIIVYSLEAALRLKNILDSAQKDAVSHCRLSVEELDIAEKTVHYTIRRYRLEIPYSAISGEVVEKLSAMRDTIQPLAILTNTLRDQHYSFMNSAANLIAGIRDAENSLAETIPQPAGSEENACDNPERESRIA